MPPRLPSLLAATALVVLASRAPAQSQLPFRPRLPASADTSDWEAYYDYGVSQLRGDRSAANDAFYWASRLEPSRAEPYFARWVTFWLVAGGRRWEKYVKGDPKVVEAPDVRAADSLRMRALVRNPFVHQGLRMMLVDMLPGYWGDDIATRAWLAYAKPDLKEAALLFGMAIERDTVKFADLRYPRALTFAAMGRADSAEHEMTSLLSSVERVQQKRLVMAWESTEQLHYALAFLRAARGALAPARQSAQTAVEQDASFYPGWALLGRIAMATRDTGAALRAFEQALLVEPGDALVLTDYGQALMQAGRPADAVAQARKAMELEPFWARPYAVVGAALDQQGDAAGAIRAYETYLVRAPSSARDRIDTARRLRELRAAAVPANP